MDKMISIPVSKYDEMINKIARFNTLINCIRQEIEAGNKYPVNDNLVLSICGLKAFKVKKDEQQN